MKYLSIILIIFLFYSCKFLDFFSDLQKSFIFISDTPKEFNWPTYIKLGTGPLSGQYHQIGRTMSKIIDQNYDDHQLKMQTIVSKGSTYNIQALLDQKIHLALVQSDVQYDAYFGKRAFTNIGPKKFIRSIMSLQDEAITILVSMVSQIKELKGIRGKKINVGPNMSGYFNNVLNIIFESGMSLSDIEALHYPIETAFKQLEEKKIDGLFYTIGHPNRAIKRLTEKGNLKIRIISPTGHEINELTTKWPYYSSTFIPIKYYPDVLNVRNAVTCGVKATLITTKFVQEEVIYTLVKEIIKNFKLLKESNPNLLSINKKGLLDSLTAPLHSGAVKYYKEVGIVE